MATSLALPTSKIVKWILQLIQEKISQASRYQKSMIEEFALLHLYLILLTTTRGMHIYRSNWAVNSTILTSLYWGQANNSTGWFTLDATFCNSWVHFPETWKYEATETTSIISILILTTVFVTALKARLALCPTHYWVMRLSLHSACTAYGLFSIFKWPSSFITRQL